MEFQTRPLIKEDIIRMVKQLAKLTELSLDSIVVGAGAACVLHGIRTTCNDIDVSTTLAKYNQLKYDGFVEKEIKGKAESTHLLKISNFIDMHVNVPGIRVCNIDGITCYDARTLLDQKLFLNRDKDQNDIIKLTSLLYGEKYYYHGSPRRLVSVNTPLIPHESRVVNNEKVVFATDRFAVALTCCQNWRDDDFQQGTVNGKLYFKEMEKGNFKKFYEGKEGYIYVVHRTQFRTDDRLTRFEFISNQPVRVVKTIFIQNILETLKSADIDLIYAR